MLFFFTSWIAKSALYYCHHFFVRISIFNMVLQIGLIGSGIITGFALIPFLMLIFLVFLNEAIARSFEITSWAFQRFWRQAKDSFSPLSAKTSLILYKNLLMIQNNLPIDDRQIVLNVFYFENSFNCKQCDF